MDNPEIKEPKKRTQFKCRGCPPENPVGLQRVQYGHIENGKFVIDEETDLACRWCHTVYKESDL